ncbi:ribonuclease H-like domain-containing protein [Tanacetum coccineum]
MKLIQFLMGLNDVFQPIRSGLLSRETLPNVKDVFAINSIEESHRGIASSSSGSVSKPRVSGFVVESNNWTNNGNKRADNKKIGNTINSGNNKGPNPNLLCTNYGKVVHTIDRCFDIISYLPGYNKNLGPKQNCSKTFNVNSASTFNEKGVTLSFTNDQIMKLINVINDVPSRYMQVNMAGFASKQNYRDCPNDDGRGSETPNDDGNVHPCTSNPDVSEGDFATSMGDNSSSKGNVPSSFGLNTQRSLPENTSQVQPDGRRSSRSVKMPAKFNDYVVNDTRKYGLEKYVTYSNLNTSTMNNEIEALNRNNTWTICDLPEGRKAVGSKWLFKIKYKSTREIERYKAWLVAKGFSQREGFDYLETFSPVVKMSIVRCMLNVAMCNNWDLFQLDINNAFLYGDLSEDVYMTLPPGFDNEKSKSKFVYSLFTKKYDNVFIALLVYVDDIVITGNDLSEIEKFKLFLKSKFQIKDLGKLKYFLGIEVLDNKDGICLSQRKYCLELLHEHGLLVAKHVDTLLPKNTTLKHIETDDDHLLDNIGNYQRLVGSGIQINNNGNLKLRAYADSDWARCPATRKSISALDIEQHKVLCEKLGLLDMFKIVEQENEVESDGDDVLLEV